MEKRKLGCNCINWARSFDEILLSNHAPGCSNRDIENEAKKHIENLLKALEYEAKMGDGIADEFFGSYQDAKYFVGHKVPDENKIV